MAKKRRKLADDPMVRAIRAHGLTNVTRALAFTAAWSIAAESLGHEPTLQEYQEWWNASRRTTFREQAAFRAVTGLDDPAPIWRRACEAGVEFDRSAGAEASGFGLLPFMHWAS